VETIAQTAEVTAPPPLVTSRTETAKRFQKLLEDRNTLRHDNDRLRDENARLRSQAKDQGAYERGRADARKEIEAKKRAEKEAAAFKERVANARNKFPDFDAAWQEVKGLVPRVVLEEIGNLPNGLIAGYYLRQNVPLCKELAGFEAEQARTRFRSFANDLAFLERR
jgi:hypothetical protein